jgi:hypothetical protein
MHAEKALAATEMDRLRLYSEKLATSPGTMVNWQKVPPHSGAAQRRTTHNFWPNCQNGRPQYLIPLDKRLIKEALDHKALQLWVNKLENLANQAVFIECKTKTDRDTLETELGKLSTVTVGRPKRKLPTLLLRFVPKEVEDADIKNIILQQNNLSHLEDPVLRPKFTKRAFEESRHVVLEVSRNLRRELVALQKIKLHWSMCKVEDFVSITRCLKCLGFGHTAKFCQNQQKCSYCAEDHHWKECENKRSICCSNCAKANTYIHNDSKKLNTNHSVFSKECSRARRIETIILSKTVY